MCLTVGGTGLYDVPQLQEAYITKSFGGHLGSVLFRMF
jgi:hypothetical protein